MKVTNRKKVVHTLYPKKKQTKISQNICSNSTKVANRCNAAKKKRKKKLSNL